MSKREMYEQKTEEILLPIVEEYGFELVDVEYVKEGSNWYLRAYIDKPGGIGVNDCEAVSRRLSDILDEKIISKILYPGSQFTRTWQTAEEGKGLQEKPWRRSRDQNLPHD